MLKPGKNRWRELGVFPTTAIQSSATAERTRHTETGIVIVSQACHFTKSLRLCRNRIWQFQIFVKNISPKLLILVLNFRRNYHSENRTHIFPINITQLSNSILTILEILRVKSTSFGQLSNVGYKVSSMRILVLTIWKNEVEKIKSNIIDPDALFSEEDYIGLQTYRKEK